MDSLYIYVLRVSLCCFCSCDRIEKGMETQSLIKIRVFLSACSIIAVAAKGCKIVVAALKNSHSFNVIQRYIYIYITKIVDAVISPC